MLKKIPTKKAKFGVSLLDLILPNKIIESETKDVEKVEKVVDHVEYPSLHSSKRSKKKLSILKKRILLVWLTDCKL